MLQAFFSIELPNRLAGIIAELGYEVTSRIILSVGYAEREFERETHISNVARERENSDARVFGLCLE